MTKYGLLTVFLTGIIQIINGQSFTESIDNVSFDMIWIKGGTFNMGCTTEQGRCPDNEKPVHKVTLDDFYIGKLEVTQKLWIAVMGNNPSYNHKCSDCPVETVTWDMTQEFLKKLNQKTGKNYRLPTEAEWEYAARGGASTSSTTAKKYSGSNVINEVAWLGENSDLKTKTVGTKKPNALGIFDMSGNVYEWCQDWYGEKYYSTGPEKNPTGPENGFRKIIRGGSWGDPEMYCMTGMRSYYNPDYISLGLGFRIVLNN